MRITALAAALLLTACASGEKNKSRPQIPKGPWSLASSVDGARKPLAALEAFEIHRGTFTNSKFAASNYWQAVGTYQALAGDTHEALEAFGKAAAGWGNAKQTLKPIPENFPIRDAIKTILTAAESKRAVFINEAHHIPRDRAFSRRLLKGLYERGYRWFAFEAYSFLDSKLAARGYPIEKTGLYVQDPVFGMLVRDAIRIGFTPVAYEDEGACDNSRKETCSTQRDMAQAKNLEERTLGIDPEAKIFVHAGYGHIYKNPTDTWKPMAWFFVNSTGLETISVDQTKLREKSDSTVEDSRRHAALERYSPRDSIALSDVDEQGKVDYFVVHPTARYEQGRSDWLTDWSNRKLIDIPEILLTGSAPLMVEAYSVSESTEAVPWDRLVVRDLENPPALALPPGRYIIKSTDGDGQARGEAPLSL